MIYPDNTLYHSAFPAYTQSQTVPTTSLLLSGSIAAGATASFSANVTVDSTNNTRFDIYATQTNAGFIRKQPFSATGTDFIYLSAALDFASHVIQQSGSTVTITIYVKNYGGSPVTIITQTYNFEVMQYKIPY